MNPFLKPNGLIKRLFLTSLFSFLCLTIALAQKEGNIGIFGEGVGLNFNTNPPEVFVLAKKYSFESDEGCATISDKEGNLLFYTNGQNVFNKNHEVMPNSQYLQEFFSSTSTTQVIIIPKPKDSYLFYIITAMCQGGPLSYALVDIRLDNGLGDVVWKERLIYEKSTEKVCVVRHATEDKLWLITHPLNTNEFRAFLIDENGLDTAYVSSTVGEVHVENPGRNPSGSNSNAIGYLKPSQDGKLLASAIAGQLDLLEIFNFDNSTGKVTNPIKLYESPGMGSYGVEFSPDNSKLYHSRGDINELYQYNLKAGSPQEIINSAHFVSPDVKGALQLGPDNKIYVIGSIPGEYLDLIHNPNAAGSLCEFEKNAVYLKGGKSQYGLPVFSYDIIAPDILVSQFCSNNETSFALENPSNIANVSWDFGDPSSGESNFSVELSPLHVYNTPGSYTVQVQVNYTNQESRTFSKKIEIFPSLTADLGKDTVVCEGSGFWLSPKVSEENVTYRWQDGSTASTFEVKTPGKYWVEVYSSYCSFTDTLLVDYLSPPSFELQDTVLCFGESLQINLNDENAVYSWSDGSGQASRSISESGIYSVTGTNECGSLTLELSVTVLPKLQLALPEEIAICANEEIVLNVFSESAQYKWHNKSTNDFLRVSREGTFWVTIYNKCEALTDSVTVRYFKAENLTFPNVITPNGDKLNEYFVIDEKLLGSKLSIFNRWGKKVYYSAGYQNNWNGEGVPPGVYYYLLEESCSKRTIKGALHLIQ